MDVRHFLLQRLDFMQQLYRNAASPFIERMQKIEAGEEPFVPPYSENSEPAFLTEWLEASDSLQVLGRFCISMLAASLHLYFKTWEQQLGKPIPDSMKPTFSKRGWFVGYQAYFRHHFGIRFEDSGCNLQLLEEIILARNRIQHPNSITTHHCHYSGEDLGRLQSPFFIGQREFEMVTTNDAGDTAWLLPPEINVMADHLGAALSEVRRFVDWLETSEH